MPRAKTMRLYIVRPGVYSARMDRKLDVRAAGRAWRLCASASLEEVWEAMGADDFDEDNIPYWMELWPAGIALAGWLAEKREEIRGRFCLDIGCGLGLTSLAGQWLGARMLAFDRQPEALSHCRASAALNCLAPPALLAMDWSRPALAKNRIWRAWASDVAYEKRFTKPLLALLRHALAPDGAAWIAEPGRDIFRDFLEQAEALGWSASLAREEILRPDPGRMSIRARIWELVDLRPEK